MKRDKAINRALSIFFTILSLAWIYPVFMIALNSFKKATAISTTTAFDLLTPETFNGLANYMDALMWLWGPRFVRWCLRRLFSATRWRVCTARGARLKRRWSLRRMLRPNFAVPPKRSTLLLLNSLASTFSWWMVQVVPANPRIFARFSMPSLRACLTRRTVRMARCS